MTRSGNTTQEAHRIYQRARQTAYRRLAEKHPEEYADLLHECQHEIGAPHIHRSEEHVHA